VSVTRFEARQLRFAIGSIRREVSFGLESGDVLQVTGPSGHGKSTLLRVLCRLTAAESGQLLLDGGPASGIPAWRWRRRVAYLAQRPVMLPGTVGENLAAAFDTSRAEARYDEPLARRLLAELALPDGALDKDARLLSGGEAQRVALCRLLLMQPQVLLADEPAAALDDESAAALVNVLGGFVRDGGMLVLVAHDERRWSALSRERLDLSEPEHRR